MSNEFFAFLHELGDAASAAIMPHFRTQFDVENKEDSGFDPVTVADKAGEEAMRKLIVSRYPKHGIWGEEYGLERAEAERVWILDPIDGTRAFITGLPTWGVLIGNRLGENADFGMMMQPFTGERYWGDGKSAHYQGPEGERELKTRACDNISDAVIFTTSPRILNEQDKAAYDRVEAQCLLPRYGMDCYAYMMVASGNADCVIEADLQTYDIAALIPIVEGAGGVVTTWEGDNPVNGGRILASGNRILHDKVLTELNA